MRLASAGPLLRTLRHLRPAQVAAQLRVRALPGWDDPSWVARRTPPPCPSVRWAPRADWLVPEFGANDAAGLHEGWFEFVGDRRRVGWPPDWSGRGASLLWQYNLHYLEWVWALPAGERAAAAGDWVRRHPPVPGAVGWAPYPTSLRLETLCLLAGEGETSARELWPSIWRQAEHLARRMERHLLGNHLLENGIALAFAGACFSGDDAERWLATGLDLLREQLPEQVLPDGVHFERSPMYQLRLVHALAFLANTGIRDVCALVVPVLARMVAALRALLHPDGGIALFNDAAFGIYPEPSRVVDFALASLGERLPAAVPVALVDAGFYVGRADGHAVFCDAGPLGPDYIPGHAHAGIFSFELSLGGRRVMVDSGTYDYVDSEMRNHCRSTAAHNTVTVDDMSQAELWGAFRMGRRGRPRDVRHVTTPDGFELSGWHDGFVHLPGRPVHRRKFRWRDTGEIRVLDEVAASRPVDVVSRFHLHPECRIVDSGDRFVRVDAGGSVASLFVEEGPRPSLEEGWYCPRFGVRERNRVIVLRSTGADIRMAVTIAAAAAEAGWRSAAGPFAPEERARGR